MPEFQSGEHLYRTKHLSAHQQHALLRAVTPVLPALSGVDIGMRLPGADIGQLSAVLLPLMQSEDAEIGAAFDAARGACEQFSGEAWGPVASGLRLAELIDITMAVVSDNFGALFAMERPKFLPVGHGRARYEPAEMPGGLSWLYRPVLRRMCLAESLHDGTLRIEHIQEMNDAADVEDENQARAHAAAKER